jgi:Ca-activated chloride channel family protein
MSFTFEYPIAFLLIIIYFLCTKYCKPKIKSIFFPNIGVLKSVSSKRGSLFAIMKFLIFLMFVTALASPIKRDDVISNRQKGYEISLILDASRSMSVGNKFEIVRGIVKDFIKNREKDKIAITVFADFAYVAVPLTYDKQALLSIMDRLYVGIAGNIQTSLYEALFLSTRVFQSSEAKDKVAILLTDGFDNTNKIPLNVAIKTAQRYGIRVYTIGIGEYDKEVLQKIAKETGGEFFSADSARRLKEIYEEIDKLEKSEFQATKYIKKSYYYQYFLGFGLILLVVYIVLYRK